MRIAATERWALGAVLGSLGVASNLFAPWFGVDAAAFSAAAQVTGFDAVWGLVGSVVVVSVGTGVGLAVLAPVGVRPARLLAAAAVGGGFGVALVAGQVAAGHTVAATFPLDRHAGAVLAVPFSAVTVLCAAGAAWSAERGARLRRGDGQRNPPN